MQKKLIKQKKELYYYSDSKKILGENPNMSGDCSELSGVCTGLRGDIDQCEITDEERKNGIDINDIVKGE